MTGRTMLIWAALFFAAPVIAQTPGAASAPKQPAHQPGEVAPGARSSTADPKTPADSAEKVDPAKEAAIRHLMDITQTSKLGDNMSNYILDQVRTGISHTLPADSVPKFMDVFSAKFATVAPGTAVTEAMIPIYAKAFSMDELQGLIQFYESPLGQRVVKTLPDVDQQSQAAGIQIEQAAALSVLRSMLDQFPELKDVLPAEPGQQSGGGAAPGEQARPSAQPAPSPAPAQH